LANLFRLSIIIHEIIFPNAQDVSRQVEWTLYNLFNISFFFLTHYTVHRATSYYATILPLFVLLKKVHSSFVLSIHSTDIAYLVFIHSIYVSHTIHVSTQTDL